MSDNLSETSARSFLVSGRVQGVCFRMSTQQKAVQLGLAGWVRNCPDGNVEVYACGHQTDLQALEQWLWQGPAMARVDGIVANEAAVTTTNEFIIRD